MARASGTEVPYLTSCVWNNWMLRMEINGEYVMEKQ